MINKKQITKLIESEIRDTDLFIVEVIIKQPNNITVLMDGDNGITIQDCINISRLIESNYDRDDEDYKLDVSSCGLDKPLKIKRQYNKYIGKQLKVVDVEGIEYSGTLTEFDDDELKLELNLSKKEIQQNAEKTKSLIIKNIKESKAIITF